MITSGSWRMGCWCYFCKWAAGVLHEEILIIFCKSIKAFSEGSGSQRELVAKGFILLKQECVNKFPKACSKAMLEEFKLLASHQHLAIKDTFYEEITLLFHKAVITLCWSCFIHHIPLYCFYEERVELISFCSLGKIGSVCGHFLLARLMVVLVVLWASSG